MTFWFFAASAESWTTASAHFEYDAVNGIAPGCLFANDASAVSERTIASTPVLVGEPASLWIRLKANNPELPVGDIDVIFSIGALTEINHSFTPGATLDYDSGWVRVAGVIEANDDVTLLAITVDGIGGNCLIYVDSVFFLESDLPAATAKFYQGIEGLVERSGLPFSSAIRTGMAVREDGKVAIGHVLGADEIVVTGSPADDYAIWTDETHDHPLVGVRTVKWIK